MTLCTYAARYQAFNPIEHLWSPMSNKLSGVMFKLKLDGEDKPLVLQSWLSKDDLREKEYRIFDQAIEDLEHY